MAWKYIPWQDIHSWECRACGKCCKYFSVPLSSYEYVQITRFYGPDVVNLGTGRTYLRKRRDKRCIFQFISGLCGLQHTGMKPIACRLWPFLVSKKPGKDPEKAVFTYREKDFYLYLHSFCTGITLGEPSEYFISILSEAIETATNPSRSHHLTSKVVDKILPKNFTLSDHRNILYPYRGSHKISNLPCIISQHLYTPEKIRNISGYHDFVNRRKLPIFYHERVMNENRETS